MQIKAILLLATLLLCQVNSFEQEFKEFMEQIKKEIDQNGGQNPNIDKEVQDFLNSLGIETPTEDETIQIMEEKYDLMNNTNITSNQRRHLNKNQNHQKNHHHKVMRIIGTGFIAFLALVVFIATIIRCKRRSVRCRIQRQVLRNQQQANQREILPNTNYSNQVMTVPAELYQPFMAFMQQQQLQQWQQYQNTQQVQQPQAPQNYAQVSQPNIAFADTQQPRNPYNNIQQC